MTTKKAEFIYTPIMKSKGGERWALSNMLAETRTRVQPVIELHTHKGKELRDHLDSVCADLAEAWAGSFYMDGIWLHDEQGNATVLNQMFLQAKTHGLSAIPVVRPSFTAAAFNRARAIADEFGRSCLIRATPEQAIEQGLIDHAVDSIGLPLDRLDFLLDYRGRRMTLVDDLPSLARIGEWRRVIASSGVSPRTVSGFPIGEWQFVPRLDWISWSNGIASGLPRDPIFSDYVTRPPGTPAGGGNPPVHLRYTSDDVWAIRVDGKHQNGQGPEMHKICASLMEHPFFRGEFFSAGDMEIVRIANANADEGAGGPMQWLEWCISHHIEQVIDQLTGVAA